MEAPPNRPGHVGYTPQPVASVLANARLAGIAGASLVVAAGHGPQLLAQRFPRIGSVAAENTRTVMLRASRAAQLLRESQPWPLDLRASMRIGTAPVSTTEETDRKAGGGYAR